jgi:hypothetical protein
MNPSNKTAEMEQSLTGIFGFDRRDQIRANKCCPPPIGCGGPATSFKDNLSQREYSISGLCQKCQDKFFGDDGEGTKMWTLENALPLIRELEEAANEWNYFTALAGSVLYKGWSENDLDIHLYAHEPEGEGDSKAAFKWFAARGWKFKLCGEPVHYDSDVTIFEAEKNGQKINLFFSNLTSVDAADCLTEGASK